MTTSALWQRAACFAARAHQNHLRKDGETPYFAHPASVAMTVAVVFGVDDEEILAAAMLHDTIEDCTVDFDEIAQVFNERVASFVATMSKDMRLPDAVREAAYDRQLAEGPWQARLIKLADVYDNFLSAHDERARMKHRSKIDRALAIAGDEPRLARAAAIVRGLIEPAIAADAAGRRA